MQFLNNRDVAQVLIMRTKAPELSSSLVTVAWARSRRTACLYRAPTQPLPMGQPSFK